MNSDDFQVRYRLLKVVSLDDGIRTHNAQETTTGRVVMVHLVYDASPDAIDRLRSILGRLPMQDKARILETATLPAGYAIVSEFIPGLTSFSAWLTAHATESTSDSVDATPGGASMFAAPAAPPVAPPLPPPVPTPAPQVFDGPGPAAPIAPKAPPGEFTQMFMKGGDPAASSMGAAPIAAPPMFTPVPAPRPAAAPQAPPQVPPAVPPQMAPPPVVPLGATHASAAMRPAPPPVAASPLPSPPPQTPSAPLPASAPGEFTQMFSKSGMGAASPGRATPFGTPAVPPAQAPSGQSPMMSYSGGLSAPSPVQPPASPPMSQPSAPPVAPRFDPPSFASPPVTPSWGAPVDRLGASNAAPPISSMGGGLGSGATGALDARRVPPPVSPVPPIMPGPPPLGPSSMAASPLGAASQAPSPHVPSMLPPPVFQAANPSGLGPSNSPMAGGAQQPAGAAGPSDYTMMITRGKGTSIPAAPAQSAPAPTAIPVAKPRVPVPLLIGLNVVVVAALALVLYFALRSKPTTSIPSPTVPKVSVPTKPK